MAGGFLVVRDELERASAGIVGTLEEASREPVGRIPHDAATIGHVGLADALGAFLTAWTTGVGNLVADGEHIAGGLRDCLTVYDRVETDTCRRLAAIGTGSGAAG